MIQHIVALKLRDGVGPDSLQDLMQELSDLVPQIAGFAAFQHGPNLDREAKSPDFPYGFICTFDDDAALARYAEDARHQALGARLVALCHGGADGIVVYDLETE